MLLFLFVYCLKIDKRLSLINIFDFTRTIGLLFIKQLLENSLYQSPTFPLILWSKLWKVYRFHRVEQALRTLIQPLNFLCSYCLQQHLQLLIQ